MGRSTIFIQPGADGCPADVKVAQDATIALADTLERRMAENEYLQGELDGCCVATEPTLDGIVASNNVDFQTCLIVETAVGAPLFDSLLTMEGTATDVHLGNTLWKTKLRGYFDDDPANLDDTYIDILPVPQGKCPASTKSVYEAAKTFETNLEDCLSFRDFLQERNDVLCEQSRVDTSQLVTANNLAYDAAKS
jgi:hypothetical protein